MIKSEISEPDGMNAVSGLGKLIIGMKWNPMQHVMICSAIDVMLIGVRCMIKSEISEPGPLGRRIKNFLNSLSIEDKRKMEVRGAVALCITDQFSDFYMIICSLLPDSAELFGYRLNEVGDPVLAGSIFLFIMITNITTAVTQKKQDYWSLFMTFIGFGTIGEYFAIGEDWDDLSQFYSTRIKEGFLESIPSSAVQFVWLFYYINRNHRIPIATSFCFGISVLSVWAVIHGLANDPIWNKTIGETILTVFFLFWLCMSRVHLYGFVIFNFPSLSEATLDPFHAVLLSISAIWMLTEISILSKLCFSWENVTTPTLVALVSFFYSITVFPLFIETISVKNRLFFLENCLWIVPCFLADIQIMYSGSCFIFDYILFPFFATIFYSIVLCHKMDAGVIKLGKCVDTFIISIFQVGFHDNEATFSTLV